MQFIRAISKPSHFKEWSKASPTLSKLLEVLKLDPRWADDKQAIVSVFRATSHTQELEVVASQFARRKTTDLEDCYAIRLTADDCENCGIDVNRVNEHGTGVLSVDDRHCNLSGTKQQFVELISRTVANIWAGQDRLKVYPRLQVGAQIAVLSCLNDSEIEPEARKRCREIIQASNHLTIDNPAEKVRIESVLQSGAKSIKVVAERPIHIPTTRVLGRLRSFFTRRWGGSSR